jgi:hypothetical protein
MTWMLLTLTVAGLAVSAGARPTAQDAPPAATVPPPSLVPPSKDVPPATPGKPFQHLFQNPKRSLEDRLHQRLDEARQQIGEQQNPALDCKILVIRPEREVDPKMIITPPATGATIRKIAPPC